MMVFKMYDNGLVFMCEVIFYYNNVIKIYIVEVEFYVILSKYLDDFKDFRFLFLFI